MALQQTTFRLLLLFVMFSVCVRAQTSYDAIDRAETGWPSGDPFARTAGNGFGERPHTMFERLDPLWANATFPSDNEPSGAPGVVSVAELRHSFSRAGKKLLHQAQNYMQAGKHSKAIEVLQRALLDSTAIGYAQSMLGAEYLKIGDLPAAISHLKEGVKVLPSLAANYSNLGYAFCRTGDLRSGEQEIRQAIKMDGASPQSHFLLGLILLNAATPEARDQLLFAQSRIPSASLALAVYHAHRGDNAAAKQELRAYLDTNPSIDPGVAEQWVKTAGALERPASAFGFPFGRYR
jgi:tetratricopeptide (TPR) repeat protein